MQSSISSLSVLGSDAENPVIYRSAGYGDEKLTTHLVTTGVEAVNSLLTLKHLLRASAPRTQAQEKGAITAGHVVITGSTGSGKSTLLSRVCDILGYPIVINGEPGTRGGSEEVTLAALLGCNAQLIHDTLKLESRRTSEVLSKEEKNKPKSQVETNGGIPWYHGKEKRGFSTVRPFATPVSADVRDYTVFYSGTTQYLLPLKEKQRNQLQQLRGVGIDSLRLAQFETSGPALSGGLSAGFLRLLTDLSVHSHQSDTTVWSVLNPLSNDELLDKVLSSVDAVVDLGSVAAGPLRVISRKRGRVWTSCADVFSLLEFLGLLSQKSAEHIAPTTVVTSSANATASNQYTVSALDLDSFDDFEI